jgi:hypothetical protein
MISAEKVVSEMRRRVAMPLVFYRCGRPGNWGGTRAGGNRVTSRLLTV